MADERVDDAEFKRTWPTDPDLWIPKAAEIALEKLLGKLRNRFTAEDAIGFAQGKLGEELGIKRALSELVELLKLLKNSHGGKVLEDKLTEYKKSPFGKGLAEDLAKNIESLTGTTLKEKLDEFVESHKSKLTALQFTHFGQLVNWLVITGRRHIYGEQRKRRNWPVLPLDDLMGVLSAAADDAEAEDEPELISVLRDCLAKLEPEERWAWILPNCYPMNDQQAGILIFAFGLEELDTALAAHKEQPLAVTSAEDCHADATKLAPVLKSVILNPFGTLKHAITDCASKKHTPIVYVRALSIKGEGADQVACYEVMIHDVAKDKCLVHLKPENPPGKTRRARGLAVWQRRDRTEECLRSCLQAAK